MTTTSMPKTERIDVRASVAVKQLLQEAALASHKSVSEFLLDAGVNAANQALSDRRHFALEEAQWEAFLAVLDRPVRAKAQLRRLIVENGVLD